MQIGLLKKWKTLVGVGLLAISGTIIVCNSVSSCTSGASANEKALVSLSSQGENLMSIVKNPTRIQHADDANFHNLILKSDAPILVDFYADWCVPCQRLTPILEELAAENPQARIVKVNVEHNPQLVAKYGIDSIPRLMIFKNGRVTGQMVGLASKNQLRKLLGF
jgi:thioredoxin 1